MKRDKGKRVEKCLISFVKMRNEDFREYDAEEDRVCENMFYVQKLRKRKSRKKLEITTEMYEGIFQFYKE